VYIGKDHFIFYIIKHDDVRDQPDSRNDKENIFLNKDRFESEPLLLLLFHTLYFYTQIKRKIVI
jgi:hypothetical protein